MMHSAASSNMGSSSETIPRLIHFVWAGGQDLPPPESIDTIIQWALKNKNWQINLWVDHSTFDGNLQAEFQALFTQRLKSLAALHEGSIHGIRVLKNENSTSLENCVNICLQDIHACEVSNDNIDYEIRKLKPNYGASSDLLRYNILYKFGGAYFDMDVVPGHDNLDSIFKHHSGGPILYVEHCTQSTELELSELQNFSFEHIGNDTFICTPKNPVLNRIIQNAKQNYDASSQPQEERSLYYIHRAHRSMRDNTIEYTGPLVVREIIQKHAKKENDEVKVGTTLLRRMRAGVGQESIELAKPHHNTLLWLQQKAVPPSKLIILDKIQQTIAIEAQKFHVLRLDDHITDYMKSCAKLQITITPETALEELSSSLTFTRLTQIQLTQISGQYPNTIAFCQKNQLQTLFDLKEIDLENAINCQIRVGTIAFVLGCEKTLTNNHIFMSKPDRWKLISDFEDGKIDVELANSDVQSIIKAKQKFDSVKNDLYDTIERTHHLYQYADKLTNEIKIQLYNNLKTACTLYKQYAFPQQKQDIQRLEFISGIESRLGPEPQPEKCLVM